MPSVLSRLRNSVTLKLAFIAFLVLVLLIPISMIEGVIAERESTAQFARQDIMQSYGYRQLVAGPLLVLPFRYPYQDKEGTTTWHHSRLFFSPEELTVNGSLAPQWRYRGLHRLNVYTTSLTVNGSFRDVDPSKLLPRGALVAWDQAMLAVSVSDARPIKERMVLKVGDTSSAFEPGGQLIPEFTGFLVAGIPSLSPQSNDFVFDFNLSLAGSEHLSFLPIGQSTVVELNSPWPSPSFDGAYLPETHIVNEKGFQARWKVLNLGRGFPSQWRGDAVTAQTLNATAFGVRLYEPASAYQQATRAVKYAVLFVAFTFVVYFLMEIFAARLLHPFQYLLVGFANCIFYLLLVSLSEHLSFAMSYGLAAVACSVLVAGYSVSVLGSAVRAGFVLCVMTTLYSFLFVVLRAEDHSLLMGSVALFVALAIVMYTTRRIDWYGLSLGAARTS